VKAYLARRIHPDAFVGEAGSRPVPRRFILYACLCGAAFGILQFGDVIARKTLGASELAVTLLSMTFPIANFTSIWWGRLLVGRDQRPAVLGAGLFGFAILSTGFFLATVPHLIGLYLFYYLTFALIIPAENRILQQHVRAGKIGRLFGVANGMRMVTSAGVAALAGYYLEKVAGGYHHLFVIAALLGLLGVWQIGSVRTGAKNNETAEPLSFSIIAGPLKKAAHLLRRRPDYFRFEAAFMIYGMAFMLLLPVIPLYLVDDLGFGYKTIGFVRGGVHLLAIALSIPVFGHLFDRSTPHRIAVGSFLTLAVFPVLLLGAGRLEGSARLNLVVAAFAVFGIGLGGLSVLWSLSSIRFAGREDAGVYHSVHVTATGIRGLFAPLLGYFVMTTWGKREALFLAACLWVLSALAMIGARLWDKKTGHARDLSAKAAEEAPEVEPLGGTVPSATPE